MPLRQFSFPSLPVLSMTVKLLTVISHCFHSLNCPSSNDRKVPHVASLISGSPFPSHWWPGGPYPHDRRNRRRRPKSSCRRVSPEKEYADAVDWWDWASTPAWASGGAPLTVAWAIAIWLPDRGPPARVRARAAWAPDGAPTSLALASAACPPHGWPPTRAIYTHGPPAELRRRT